MRRKYYSFWERFSKKNEEAFINDIESEYYQSYVPPRPRYHDIYHTTHEYTGYTAYYSSFSSFNKIGRDESVNKFLNVYKHISDLKSIIGLDENIKISYCSDRNMKNSDTIYIDTRMFDYIDNDDDALNCCLGGSLFAFAMNIMGISEVNNFYEKNKKEFPNYETYILTHFPGYYTLIEEYNKFLIDHPYGIKMSSRSLTNDLIAKMASGEIVKSTFGYILDPPINNVEEYKLIYNKISGYINTISNNISKFCINTSEKQIGARNGTLDSNKLVEAIQGAPNVYFNKYDKISPAIDICILVDESGSMCGNRIFLTKAAVILINEACKNISNCNLFIYGHSADIIDSGSVEIYKYKDKYLNNPYALGSIKARKQNRDGNAIRETIKQVRSQSKNKILMFILSDGNPAADNYGGISAIKDTKKAVDDVEKDNVIITQCTFLGQNIQSEQMFKRYIEIDTYDVSEFVVKFTKHITDKLVEEYTK